MHLKAAELRAAVVMEAYLQQAGHMVTWPSLRGIGSAGL